MSRNVLLTHYDLDGVGCDILLSKIFPFEKKFKCGYSKAAEYIRDGLLSSYDSCVVSDMSLTRDQFEDLSREYKEKLLYIDHHKASVEMIENITHPSCCVTDNTFSGTGLTFQYFVKALDKLPNILRFVVSVDAYDCWRFKTHESSFLDGYNLNTLFWKYKYNDFFKRFSKDFSMVWTEQEQNWIDNHLTDRDNSLEKSDKTEFGDNSLLVLDTPVGFINDYGLKYPEYDFFYLLYHSISGDLCLSIRTTLKGVDVGKAIVDTKRNWECIHTGGGHREAGGVSFVRDTNLEMILDVVEDINNTLEIPF